jgi:hypothetical protein
MLPRRKAQNIAMRTDGFLRNECSSVGPNGDLSGRFIKTK